MKNTLKIFSFFIITLFVSCTSSHTPQLALPNDVAPNSCRISGTVIQIKDFNDPSITCIANPCNVKIKIDDIQKTGMSFKTPLKKGETIRVNFILKASNLSKTLNRNIRGLRVGDKFTADVERIELIQLGNKNEKFEYRISKYILK